MALKSSLLSSVGASVLYIWFFDQQARVKYIPFSHVDAKLAVEVWRNK